jgi:predicted nucleic acid-binding protein
VRGLLDTSVFIAGQEGRRLAGDRLPDEAAISVVTLAELELGVQMAASEAVRGVRLRTLQATQSTYVALPVDTDVASAFAELVATARRAGRRPKVQDAWIAATARAAGVPVFTQDGDFDDLAVDVVRI